MALDNPAFSRNSAFSQQGAVAAAQNVSAQQLQELYDQPATLPDREVMTVENTVAKTAGAFAVLLVGGSATAFVAYQRLNGNITRENVNDLIGSDKERPPKVAEDPKAKNILIMGSDKRKGKNALNVEGQRSDTTILVHVAADRKSATEIGRASCRERV